jgi:molybdenum cofactor cytidylyltransferase
MIGAVILAAGSGSRFDGGPKQLAAVAGTGMLQRVVNAVAAAECFHETLVVLGYEADRIRSSLDLPDTGQIVLNLDHEQGEAVSLSCGLLAVDPAVEAVVLLAGDRPGVRPTDLRRLVTTYEQTRMPVVRAMHPDGPGAVLVAEGSWDDLMAAGGPTEAWFEENEDLIEVVHIDVPAPVDVDTRADLEAAETALG